MKNKITDKNIEAFKSYVPGHNLDEISARFGVCKSYVASVLKILALRGVDIDYVRRPCGARPGSKHKRGGGKSLRPSEKGD